MKEKYYWICESFVADEKVGIFRVLGCFKSFWKALWEMYKLGWQLRYNKINKLYITERGYSVNTEGQGKD